jgi:hypothetical protein
MPSTANFPPLAASWLPRRLLLTAFPHPEQFKSSGSAFCGEPLPAFLFRSQDSSLAVLFSLGAHFFAGRRQQIEAEAFSLRDLAKNSSMAQLPTRVMPAAGAPVGASSDRR